MQPFLFSPFDLRFQQSDLTQSPGQGRQGEFVAKFVNGFQQSDLTQSPGPL
jgi:hypothetical protein